jgi:four helix bundle protein
MENRKEEKPETPKQKIGDFKELRVWQEARKLRAAVYRITRSFPKEEAYGLVSQMRRAAVSVTANLAEGYGRFSYQENVQFCRQSRASIYELRDHFTSALDAAYVSSDQYDELESQAMHVVRLVNGYIRSTLKLQNEKKTGMAL